MDFTCIVLYVHHFSGKSHNTFCKIEILAKVDLKKIVNVFLPSILQQRHGSCICQCGAKNRWFLQLPHNCPKNPYFQMAITFFAHLGFWGTLSFKFYIPCGFKKVKKTAGNLYHQFPACYKV